MVTLIGRAFPSELLSPRMDLAIVLFFVIDVLFPRYLMVLFIELFKFIDSFFQFMASSLEDLVETLIEPSNDDIHDDCHDYEAVLPRTLRDAMPERVLPLRIRR